MPTAEAAPKKPVRALVVKAKRDGTYPRPGETYAIYRPQGSVFTLNDNDHFAKEWMVEVRDGEVPPDEVPVGIPQTTSRVNRTVSPFPPLG